MTTDVVVCCRDRGDGANASSFPAVRAQCAAKYLAKLGVRAEYRTIPDDEIRSQVVILSDYQPDRTSFERVLPALRSIPASRYYCFSNTGLAASHENRHGPARWFAAAGGLLVHLSSSPLGTNERYVGIGVDTDVVRFDAAAARNRLLFDFPGDTWTDVAIDALRQVRARFRQCRLVGSGPADAAVRDLFDEWWGYGQPHANYVDIFRGCAAFMPGWRESMGLAVAEAQLNGASIVAPFGWVKREMACRDSRVDYVGGTAGLTEGIAHALEQRGADIAEEARERFSAVTFAKRVLEAIDLPRRGSRASKAAVDTAAGSEAARRGVFVVGEFAARPHALSAALSASGLSDLGRTAQSDGAAWGLAGAKNLLTALLRRERPSPSIGPCDARLEAAVVTEGPEANEAVDALSDAGRAWFWDEPALGMLAPFWLRSAPEVAVVVLVRSPVTFAAEMRQEHGTSFRAGFLLWQAYMWRLVRHLEPRPAVLFVDERRLHQSPAAECRRIAAFLQRHLDEPSDQAVLAAMASAVVRTSWRDPEVVAPLGAMTAATPSQVALRRHLEQRAADERDGATLDAIAPPADWRSELIAEERRVRLGERVV